MKACKKELRDGDRTETAKSVSRQRRRDRATKRAVRSC
jgi:hypothetical protein